MIRLTILSYSRSLVAEADTEVLATYFAAACILHDNGGGYRPHVNCNVEDGNRVYRVTEKHGDGEMDLVQAWMEIVRSLKAYNLSDYEVNDAFKREVNDRWKFRRNRPENDTSGYFKVDE